MARHDKTLEAIFHRPTLGTIAWKDMMTYKGYAGEIVAFDETQGILHGELIGITDVVTFQGRSGKELSQAFHDSVDDYLAFCAERDKTPEKPFSGRFVVRIPSELHSAASLAARSSNQSLNGWLKSLIEQAVKPIRAAHGRHRRRA